MKENSVYIKQNVSKAMSKLMSKLTSKATEQLGHGVVIQLFRRHSHAVRGKRASGGANGKEVSMKQAVSQLVLDVTSHFAPAFSVGEMFHHKRMLQNFRHFGTVVKLHERKLIEPLPNVTRRTAMQPNAFRRFHIKIDEMALLDLRAPRLER